MRRRDGGSINRSIKQLYWLNFMKDLVLITDYLWYYVVVQTACVQTLNVCHKCALLLSITGDVDDWYLNLKWDLLRWLSHDIMRLSLCSCDTVNGDNTQEIKQKSIMSSPFENFLPMTKSQSDSDLTPVQASCSVNLFLSFASVSSFMSSSPSSCPWRLQSQFVQPDFLAVWTKSTLLL